MRELKHHLLLENELIGSAYPIYAFVSLILPGVLIDSARTCLNAPGLNTLENKVKLLVLKELKKLWDKEEPDLPWQQGEFSHSTPSSWTIPLTKLCAILYLSNISYMPSFSTFTYTEYDTQLLLSILCSRILQFFLAPTVT